MGMAGAAAFDAHPQALELLVLLQAAGAATSSQAHQPENAEY